MTDLAEATAALVAATAELTLFKGEMSDYFAGEADGGPNNDGYYPFTQPDTTVMLVPSPARLMASSLQTVGNGAVLLDGVVASGLGFPRNDAQLVIQSPAAGVAGQRHALQMFLQPHGDDEIAVTGYHKLSDGTWIQSFAMFTAFEAHNDNEATHWCPYTGFHGSSWRGDFLPLILYFDNRVEVCGGSITIPPLFDRGLTDPDVFHNFANSFLQGWTVMGNHKQSVQSGNILEVNGPTFFGTIDGDGDSDLGIGLFWHVPSANAYLQAYAWSTGTYQNMVIASAALKLNVSAIGFFGHATASQQTLAAAASDAATTQTLANSLRSMALAYGLAA